MFFALSKVVWFLVQPSSLIALALGYGLFESMRGRHPSARRWLLGGIVALLIGGLLPLADFLNGPLDNRFPRADLSRGAITGIIVLGGAEDARAPGDRELMALDDAGERLTEAVALARRLPGARLVYSGGSDALLRKGPAEAQTAGRLFIALGIEPGRLTLEDKSRNTAENASFTKALVNPQAGERWLLVTSAWHMPRAFGCFRAVGFVVEAWPVDYRSAAEFQPLRFHSSIAEGLRRLDTVTKEYVGLLAYRLTGRIDTLLPGPAPPPVEAIVGQPSPALAPVH